MQVFILQIKVGLSVNELRLTIKLKLGKFSESALEARNKDRRIGRLQHSRKSSRNKPECEYGSICKF